MSGHSLPDVRLWEASAARRADLFAPLRAGARIGLAARELPQEVLLWEATAGGVAARAAPCAPDGQPGVDVLLSADDAALSAIRQAVDPGDGAAQTAGATGAVNHGADLFAVMRRHIREGTLLCFMMRPRPELEELGYEELLEALGFAFLGGCR